MSRKFNKTKFPGIYLLNTTNGDIVYYAFYRQEGKQVCDKLGKRSRVGIFLRLGMQEFKELLVAKRPLYPENVDKL